MSKHDYIQYEKDLNVNHYDDSDDEIDEYNDQISLINPNVIDGESSHGNISNFTYENSQNHSKYHSSHRNPYENSFQYSINQLNQNAQSFLHRIIPILTASDDEYDSDIGSDSEIEMELDMNAVRDEDISNTNIQSDQNSSVVDSLMAVSGDKDNNNTMHSTVNDCSNSYMNLSSKIDKSMDAYGNVDDCINNSSKHTATMIIPDACLIPTNESQQLRLRHTPANANNINQASMLKRTTTGVRSKERLNQETLKRYKYVKAIKAKRVEFRKREWKASKYKYYSHIGSPNVWLMLLQVCCFITLLFSNNLQIIWSMLKGANFPLDTLRTFGAITPAMVVTYHPSIVFQLLLSTIYTYNIMELFTNVCILYILGGYIAQLVTPGVFFTVYVSSSCFGLFIKGMSISIYKSSIQKQTNTPIWNALGSGDALDTPLTGAGLGVFGLICIWLVWIHYRWKQVPSKRMKLKRNQQYISLWMCSIFTICWGYLQSKAEGNALIASGFQSITLSCYLLKDVLIKTKNKKIRVSYSAITVLFATYLGIVLYILK